MSDIRFMLDTNIVSAIMRSPHDSQVRHAFDAVKASELCVSIVTASELRFGLENKPSVKLAERLNGFFSLVPIVPLEAPTDDHYADIRAYLKRSGRLIGGNDLFHCRSRSGAGCDAGDGECRRVFPCPICASRTGLIDLMRGAA